MGQAGPSQFPPTDTAAGWCELHHGAKVETRAHWERAWRHLASCGTLGASYRTALQPKRGAPAFASRRYCAKNWCCCHPQTPPISQPDDEHEPLLGRIGAAAKHGAATWMRSAAYGRHGGLRNRWRARPRGSHGPTIWQFLPTRRRPFCCTTQSFREALPLLEESELILQWRLKEIRQRIAAGTRSCLSQKVAEAPGEAGPRFLYAAARLVSVVSLPSPSKAQRTPPTRRIGSRGGHLSGRIRLSSGPATFARSPWLCNGGGTFHRANARLGVHGERPWIMRTSSCVPTLRKEGRRPFATPKERRHVALK